MTPSSALLRISAPMLIWAAHFLAIYAFTAVACARGFAATRVLDISIVSWAIGIATLVAAVAALVTVHVAVSRRRGDENEVAAFVHWISAAAGCLVLLAVLWEALPVLLVPVCS